MTAPLARSLRRFAGGEDNPSWEDVPEKVECMTGGRRWIPRSQRIDAAVRCSRYIEDPGAIRKGRGVSRDRSEVQCCARTFLWKANRRRRVRSLRKSLGAALEDRFLQQLALVTSKLAISPRRSVFSHHRTAANPIRSHETPLGTLKLARGDLGGALCALLDAEAMNPQLPGVYIQTATPTPLLQWQNAKSAYEKAVMLDSDNARAYLGLSRFIVGSRQPADGPITPCVP